MSLFSLLGVPVAYAADVAPVATAAQSRPSVFSMLWLPALLILVFYFLLIRPQSKRVKEQKALLSNIAIGDEVITAGGILGRVVKLKDTYVTLEVAKDIHVVLQKTSIAALLPKGTVDSF